MSKKSFSWKAGLQVLFASSLSILIIFSFRFYAPLVQRHFTAPSQCTYVIDTNGEHDYCLDEQLRIPLDCIHSRAVSSSQRCSSLYRLSESNKKSFQFSIFGHDVSIKRQNSQIKI